MTTTYERRLINDPELSIAFPDALGGMPQIDDLTIELSNEDGFFNQLDLRNSLLSDLQRFDRADGEILSQFSGRVLEQTLLGDRVVLRVGNQDIQDLQTLIPKRVVTAALFPKAHATAGLNRPITVAFGNVEKVELPFVNDDIVSNFYDYLVGEGTPTVTAIYRDTVGNTIAVVPPAEYSINDAAFPGFRVVRFTKRQVTFGGGLHRIFADLTGLQTERNFARAIQTILTNTTWGLGLTADSALFTTAAGDLDAIGSLFCDGVLSEPRPALDVINQMLIVRGMMPFKTSAGAWALTVDKASTVIQARFGHGPNQPWRNVSQFGGFTKTPLGEAVKKLVLEYRRDLPTNAYLLAVSRAVLDLGTERRIQHDFIRNSTTADKTVGYLGKRLFYADDRITYEAGQEARALSPGHLLQYDSPSLSLSNRTLRVSRVRRRLSQVTLDVEGWDPTLYVYQAGTIPPEPGSGSDTDTSRSTPTAPSALSIASSGTEQSTEGTTVAFVVLQYTIPAETWAQTLVKYRRNGATNWQTAAVEGTTGAALQTKITGLIPGLSYDYMVERVNLVDASLRSNVQLTAQVAPGDTTAPTAPSAIAVRQGTGKSVEIDLTFTAPADWGTTELYRNTTNNSGTATLIETKKAKRFHDANVTLGTQYFYWAKVVDLTGNKSGFSPSSSHSITPATVPDSHIGGMDVSKLIGQIISSQIFSVAVATLVGQILGGQIADLAITNAKIGNLAVGTLKVADQAITTSKRQLLGSISFTATVFALSDGPFTFFHALGVIPIITVKMIGEATIAQWITWVVTQLDADFSTVLTYNHRSTNMIVAVTVTYF